jgi:hypothetical protein
MSRLIKPALVFAVIFMLPAVASAVDMDFYTYGGFQPVVDAFTQITLIFGDSSYQALYYTAVVCGIGFGATAAFMMLIGGRGCNILGWAPVAALGISIYIGLFVPKGNLVVYDPVFNKFQTVPNVPDGVVIVAGSLNAIERGLVEIVSNSASPTAYQTQAGGIGYMCLYNLTTQPATASSSFLDMNIDRYVQDCVSFALNNPASGLTVDELRKTTTNFATSFAKAKNPAITTLYYSAANPQGVPQGCDVDWAQISGTDLTAASLQNNINSACSTLNYDVTDPLQLSQCQTNMINLAKSGNLTTGDINSLMQQIYLYNRLDDYYQSGNSSAITNYNFMMNASGSMKAADEWIPILKAALTAIAVALIPFLAVFIPTPICGRALNLMFGMFLWLALWGICDAIIHQFAISYAYNVWDAVRQNNLGMDALYFFPNMTVKALAMFGTLRLGGLLLATALTTMLTKFGGSVMGMLAGNITGQLQAAGTSAEWKTTDPAGRAQLIEANTRALPTEAWAASNPLSTRGGEVFASKQGGTEAYETMSKNFGGPQGAAEMKRLSEVGRETRYGGMGKGAEDFGLSKAFGLNTFGAEAGLTEMGDYQHSFSSPGELGHANAAPKVAMSDVALANQMLPSEYARSRALFSEAMGYGEQKTVQGYLGAGPMQTGDAVGGARGTQDTEQVKRSEQLRAAANYAAPNSWKSDPELYNPKTHQLTGKGVARFFASMHGHVEYRTAHGTASLDLDSSGRPVMSAEVGVMPGSDQKGIAALAKRLEASGLRNDAAAVRALGNSGESFGFGISYGPQGPTGPITGFTANRGGPVTYEDLYKHTTGSDIQRIDRKTVTMDKGLRETIGDFIKTGYSHEEFNLHSVTGARMIEVSGKQQLVNGEWYYARNSKTGKDELIGGSFINGMSGNVLMFQQGQDSALHYAQLQGKFDAKGNLVAGSASEITRTDFVEAIKDNKGNVEGQAVVERKGASGSPSVTADAQGGKHVDVSDTYKMGTGVTSVQTLAGSAAQGEFEQGNQLEVGAAARSIAIWERSISETADKISQGKNVFGTLRDPLGKKEKLEAKQVRSAEYAQQKTERQAEQRGRDSSAKTTRTLQHQSNTSNLPKSGGPPPLKSR